MQNSAASRRFVGDSEGIRSLQRELAIVASSDARVLITGESGVGKDIVARAIHEASLRRNQPYIPVNCAGIPETLLESEMFGHLRGSFTGAHRDKLGKLEMARGGTIFLDEIGEMSLRMQGLLLRFLETGEIQKLGSERVWFAANVRVISATNRSLHDQITNGQFREDLYYRLNVIHLEVPPLRERREDIPLLVEYFLRNSTESHSRPPRRVSPAAAAALSQYSWPGNVRQLENVVERLVVMGQSEVIQIDDLPVDIRTSSESVAPPIKKRNGTTAHELFAKLVNDRESFWKVVYPLYINRHITRDDVRDIIHKGLQEARGNYKIVLQMFNMDRSEYKRFLDFLRNHDCKLSFKEYRTNQPPTAVAAGTTVFDEPQSIDVRNSQ
jgi:DNA-binding NtrC family response regulator